MGNAFNKSNHDAMVKIEDIPAISVITLYPEDVDGAPDIGDVNGDKHIKLLKIFFNLFYKHIKKN